MAIKDMKKTTLIIKTRLYDWMVMPFGLKNASNTFMRIMLEVFKNLEDKFLKVFVNDLNVHSERVGRNIFNIWMLCFSNSEK
jgi:hypothetical protein